MNNLELKEIRSNSGLSQGDFANKLKLSISIVQKWEQGKKNIPENSALLIKNIFVLGKSDTEKSLSLNKEGVSFSETEVVDWVFKNFDNLRSNNKYFDLVMQDVETKAVTKFLESKGIKVMYK